MNFEAAVIYCGLIAAFLGFLCVASVLCDYVLPYLCEVAHYVFIERRQERSVQASASAYECSSPSFELSEEQEILLDLICVRQSAGTDEWDEMLAA